MAHGHGVAIDRASASPAHFVGREVSDDLMPGVVSVPHGWGHDTAGAQLRVAATQAGINANLLSDEQVVDAPSGTTVLNGIPVTLTPA